MEYKPKKEDILYAKNVYDTIVKTQVLNPTLLKDAYQRMKGYPAQSQTQAKIFLTAYFTYTYKEAIQEVVEDLVDLGIIGVDKTDTTAPEVVPAKDKQSHSEDGDADYYHIKHLEEDYTFAETANEKRSITMRIKALKKSNPNWDKQ